MYESMINIPNFSKNPMIRPWLNITMLKNGDKLQPYSPMVEANGVYYFIQEFEDKFNKKIKNLMR